MPGLTEGIGLAPAISTSFGIVVLWTVAVLVITRRLVWHTDLAKVQRESDEWRRMALRGLSATETLAQAAEVTTEVLSPPDPSRE